MKRTILVLLLLLCGATNGAAAGSDFEKMKTLVGEWEATAPDVKGRVSYQLISQGTALMETIVNEGMVTVYHPDGESILMTHYCAVGNQPRMRARGSQGNTLEFQFVDVANLKSSTAGHMQRLVIRFIDKDHVNEEWTWTADGKETTSVFQLRRVK